MTPHLVRPEAIVLFGHGSRDPRWAQTMEAVAARMRMQVPEVEVHCAFLEFMQPDLPSVLRQLSEQACSSVRIAPMFLAAGGHVLRDLPELVNEAMAGAAPMQIEILPALGAMPEVLDALAAAACR